MEGRRIGLTRSVDLPLRRLVDERRRELTMGFARRRLLLAASQPDFRSKRREKRVHQRVTQTAPRCGVGQYRLGEAVDVGASPWFFGFRHNQFLSVGG